MRNFTDKRNLVMTGGANKGRLLSSYRGAPLRAETATAKGEKPRRVSRKAPSARGRFRAPTKKGTPWKSSRGTSGRKRTRLNVQEKNFHRG